jgi:transcriptional regulator with XRE-family HTH domain
VSTDTVALKEFVLGKAKERSLSLRKISADIGVTHAYLSQILNGKRSLNVVLANKIADYLDIQRIVLYRVAGWIDLNSEEELKAHLREYAKKDKDLARMIETIIRSIEDPKKRKSMFRLMIAGLDE